MQNVLAEKLLDVETGTTFFTVRRESHVLLLSSKRCHLDSYRALFAADNVRRGGNESTISSVSLKLGHNYLIVTSRAHTEMDEQHACYLNEMAT